MSMFHVGDICRVKDYNRMIDEYGFDADCTNDIDVPFFFTEEMKYMCGKTFTIKDTPEMVLEIHGKRSVITRYFSEEGIERNYKISEEMLEPIDVTDVEYDLASDEQLKSFLSR